MPYSSVLEDYDVIPYSNHKNTRHNLPEDSNYRRFRIAQKKSKEIYPCNILWQKFIFVLKRVNFDTAL